MTGMDDWHGWLAWMNGMDDWRFELFELFELFLHIVYRRTDWRTDLHWYLLSRYRNWKHLITTVLPQFLSTHLNSTFNIRKVQIWPCKSQFCISTARNKRYFHFLKASAEVYLWLNLIYQIFVKTWTQQNSVEYSLSYFPWNCCKWTNGNWKWVRTRLDETTKNSS